MKKTKSSAAYTNIWLRRNQKHWHIEHIDNIPIIILDKKDAPKIVVKRVREINIKNGWDGWSTTDEIFIKLLESGDLY